MDYAGLSRPWCYRLKMRVVSVVRICSAVAFAWALGIVSMSLDHVLMASSWVAKGFVAVLVTTLVRFSSGTKTANKKMKTSFQDQTHTVY